MILKRRPPTRNAEDPSGLFRSAFDGSFWARLKERALPGEGTSMIRGAALLMRGTVIAQIIGIALLPLLTRLFPVEAFGQFQLYLSILNVALVCASMRYEFAILTARNIREISSLIQLSLLIIILVATIFGTALAGVSAWPAIVDTSNWSFGGLFLAAGIVAGGIYQLLGYIVTRFAAYRQGGNARIFMASANSGSALMIGLIKPLQTGIIIGDIAGKIVASGHLAIVARGYGARMWPLSSGRRIRAVARRYRNYALVSVPSGLVSALSASIAPVMLLTTFGPNVTGQFGLVDRTFTLGANVITATLAQVYTNRLAEQFRNREIAEARALFRKTACFLAIALLIPCAALAWGAPLAFKIVFGAKWALAGQLCQIMAAYYYISMIQGVFMYALFTLHRQRIQLFWELARLPVLVLVWFCIRMFGLQALTAIAVHYITLSAFSLIFLSLVSHTLRTSTVENRAGDHIVDPTPIS